jgi:lysophospholipase L1-like esterase
MPKIFPCLALPVLFLLCGPAGRARADDLTPGPKIAFFGDNTMQLEAQKPLGFIHLVDLAYRQQGQAITLFALGAAGNTSRDLLGRLGRDVLGKKPDWMILSCGPSDVSRGAKNIPLDQYEAAVTAMADQAAAAGVKVLLVTPLVFGEDPAHPPNPTLAPYTDFLRSFAQQRNLPLADVNADMQAAITRDRNQTHLTSHFLTLNDTDLNSVGDELVAAALLKGLGFTPAQIAQARDLWLDLPGGMDLTLHPPLSVRQYLLLQALAAEQGRSVADLINEALIENLQKQLIKAPSALPDAKKH